MLSEVEALSFETKRPFDYLPCRQAGAQGDTKDIFEMACNNNNY